MRKYVKGGMPEKMLGIIENRLGYQIRSETLSPAEYAIKTCGVQKMPAGWIFKSPPKGYPLPRQDDLIHEMLHIALGIEGWPSWGTTVQLDPSHDVSLALDVLVPLAEHTEVWSALKELGCSSHENEAEEVTRFLIPAIRQRRVAPTRTQEAGQSIAALYLAQALLAPISDEVKNRLRQAAGQYMRQSLKLSCAVCTVYEEHQPFSPQSSVTALQDALTLLQLPPGILQPSFPDKAAPGFFADLLKKTKEKRGS